MGTDHTPKLQSGSAKYKKRLIIALCITTGVVVVQAIFAFISQSLALLADAGHMLSDSGGLLIALLATWIAGKAATSKKTFGYLRAEILAALINAVILIVMAILIFIGAIERLGQEPEIQTSWMLAGATIGGIANFISLMVLRQGKDESLNLKGAYLEVFGDLLGSIAVIIAAIIITLTGWAQADAFASMFIACLIFPRALKLLREVVTVLLEGVPPEIDMNDLKKHLENTQYVVRVHDIHLWTITTGITAFTAHIVVADENITSKKVDSILVELNDCLEDHFDTVHTTLQIEPVGHEHTELEY